MAGLQQDHELVVGDDALRIGLARFAHRLQSGRLDRILVLDARLVRWGLGRVLGRIGLLARVIDHVHGGAAVHRGLQPGEQLWLLELIDHRMQAVAAVLGRGQEGQQRFVQAPRQPLQRRRDLGRVVVAELVVVGLAGRRAAIEEHGGRG